MAPQLGNLLLLLLLLAVVGKSASWAVRSAISLSRVFGWSEFTISFLIVTFISILPEAIISVLSALNGTPSLGLGVLWGSNFADLTFVLGVVALVARRPVAVDSVFLKKDYLFLAFLLLPLMLGFTGHFSRLDGILLVAGSALFLREMLREKGLPPRQLNHQNNHSRRSLIWSFGLLTASLLILGVAGHYTVETATGIAQLFGVSAALIGFIVALGTTAPELLFATNAARKAHPTLALGDILGTVIIDATLVLGIIALIRPFSFNPRIAILTGTFVILAGIFSLSMLRSGRELTKSEGALLLAFYAIFIIVEFILRDWTPLI